jgi:hypothetical protein
MLTKNAGMLEMLGKGRSQLKNMHRLQWPKAKTKSGQLRWRDVYTCYGTLRDLLGTGSCLRRG